MIRSGPSRFALRLLGSVIPVAFLGILVIGTFSYWLARRYVVDSVKQDIQSMGIDGAHRLASFFRTRASDLEMISEAPLFSDYANNRDYGLVQEAAAYRRQIEVYFDRFSRRTGAYDGIWYLDDRGREISRAPGNRSFAEFSAGLGAPDQLIADTSLNAGRFFPAPVADARPTLLYVRRLFRSSGEPSGAIALACSLRPIDEILDGAGAARSWRACISAADQTPIYPMGATAAERGPRSPYVNYTNIPNTPWKIATLVDFDDFLSPLRRIRNLTLVASFLCLLLMAALLYRRIHVMTRPIRQLKHATQRLTAGHLDERVPTTSRDEVGDLQKAFNIMASTLQQDSIENAALLANVRRSQARYMTTVESSLDAIIGLDDELRIVTWNRGARGIFGFDESDVTGRPFTVLFPEADGAAIADRIKREGFLGSHDVEIVGKNKETRMLSLTCAGAFDPETRNKEWSMVIRDVTHQKRLQAQLIQAEKLGIVGQLISGIAHEINNPLGALAGYAELLLAENNGLTPAMREELQFIYDNADRCREIVKNLLRFVRQEQLKKSPVHLNKLVRMGLRLLEHKIVHKESIHLVYDLDPNLPLVHVDAQQIEQVIVNIIYNACDALSGMEGRKEILLRTRTDGPHSVIEIVDNGPGIPDDIREKIFEPFFTTKGEGRGTGLGLAISRQIIQDHGGSLSVSCGKPPASTTFSIRLPHVSAVPDNEPSDERRPTARVPGKSVLIVDDRSDTTSLMRKLLVEEGDAVRVVRNFKEATKRLQEATYDLVICALKGGPIAGIDLLSTLRQITPPPALLVVTGDLISSQMAEEFRENGLFYLQKPFSLSEFRRTIRGILAGNPSDSSAQHAPL